MLFCCMKAAAAITFMVAGRIYKILHVKKSFNGVLAALVPKSAARCENGASTTNKAAAIDFALTYAFFWE